MPARRQRDLRARQGHRDRPGRAGRGRDRLQGAHRRGQGHRREGRPGPEARHPPPRLRRRSRARRLLRGARADLSRSGRFDMGRPTDSREVLIAELLGELRRLLDRIEPLPRPTTARKALERGQAGPPRGRWRSQRLEAIQQARTSPRRGHRSKTTPSKTSSSARTSSRRTRCRRQTRPRCRESSRTHLQQGDDPPLRELAQRSSGNRRSGRMTLARLAGSRPITGRAVYRGSARPLFLIGSSPRAWRVAANRRRGPGSSA